MMKFNFQTFYYFGALSLFIIGMYGILTRKNMLFLLVSLSIVDTGINMFLIATGFKPGATAPIFTDKIKVGVSMVDPIPQALVLTSIVIGVSITALGLGIAIKLYQKTGTLNLDNIRGLKW